MRAWLKGGLIGLGLGILYTLQIAISSKPGYFFSLGEAIFLSIILFGGVGFIIGALIGWIVGKFRNRSE